MDRYNFNYRFGLQTIHDSYLYLQQYSMVFRGFTGVHNLVTLFREFLFFFV